MEEGRIVGISYDLSTVGLALSDASRLIATPESSWSAAKQLKTTARAIAERIAESEKKYGDTIATIVVGMPLMMSGRVGFLGDEIRHLVELLREHTSISIVLWDGRLAAVQADRSLRNSTLSSGKRRQRHRQVAAAIMLQSYLDYLTPDCDL